MCWFLLLLSSIIVSVTFTCAANSALPIRSDITRLENNESENCLSNFPTDQETKKARLYLNKNCCFDLVGAAVLAGSQWRNMTIPEIHARMLLEYVWEDTGIWMGTCL